MNLASLRESYLITPLTLALLNLFTFTFRALGRNHIAVFPFEAIRLGFF
jgi:hypothetical protein